MFGMIGQGVGAASTSLKELTLPVSIHPSGIFFSLFFFLGGGDRTYPLGRGDLIQWPNLVSKHNSR